MGFEAYDMPEKEYQAEVNYLSLIAVNVYHSDHGSFLKAMADAWCKADPSNKRIIRQAWAAIVTKYGLEAELDV